MIFIVLLLVLVSLILLLYKERNKTTQVRLEKKITLSEKIQKFINKYQTYLFMILMALLLIFIIIFIIMFVPGTESGLWYNGGVENVV